MCAYWSPFNDDKIVGTFAVKDFIESIFYGGIDGWAGEKTVTITTNFTA